MMDAELLARSSQGDDAAFRILYERHVKAVFSFAWLLMNSKADAEDVTQECFLVLMRKAAAFDPSKAQVRTWMLSVTRAAATRWVTQFGAPGTAPTGRVCVCGCSGEDDADTPDRTAARHLRSSSRSWKSALRKVLEERGDGYERRLSSRDHGVAEACRRTVTNRRRLGMKARLTAR
jgi:RNA polymerase sigma factor (sigma-70 family)